MSDFISAVTLPEGSKGPWTIKRFDVKPLSLDNLRLAREGRACAPGTYTMLVHTKHGIVMSDTTAERRDHYEFIHAASGCCLINGLGLGMCLSAILRKESVKNVIVIELSQDLIDLVAPHFSDERCQIVCADAFEWKWEKGSHFQAVWHDIWYDLSEDNLPQMKALHRKFGRVTEWQGSWGRSTIERLRRRKGW